MPIEPEITEFIQEHHVMTLATNNGEQPYCASVFYAFAPEGGDFIFLSDRATRHGWEMAANPLAAAAIHTETLEVSAIQGVQITGTITELSLDGEGDEYRELYYNAFPFARNADSVFWTLRAEFIKMTDNRVAFGYKRTWKNNTKRQ